MSTNELPKTMGDFESPADYMVHVKGHQDTFSPMTPLAERVQAGDVKLADGGISEAEFHKQFGFSASIANLAKLAQKKGGYQRDGNVTERLEQQAIIGSNAIDDLIFNAACTNRVGRAAAEQTRIEERETEITKMEFARKGRLADIPKEHSTLLATIEQFKVERERLGHEGTAEDVEKITATLERQEKEADSLEQEALTLAEQPTPADLDALYNRWSASNSVMLWLAIEEERYGIEAVEEYYPEYEKQEALRRKTEHEAANMPGPYFMLFWCKVRLLQVNQERLFDLAMGWPVEDFTDVKQQLVAAGTFTTWSR